jgi:hypothetical protein
MHHSGTFVRRNNGAAPGASLCRRDDAVITGRMSRVAAPILSVALAAVVQVTQMALAPGAFAGPHDALIAKHAAANGVPEQLVRRIIRIESRGNAAAVHAGNYGLMQIRLGTARGVGYSGNAEGLLDPDTNLTYAVKYLAGAYRAAGCDADRTVSYYQRGYYGAALRECAGSASPPLTQIAQAESKTTAKLKRDAAAAKPTDVIKPKVVRTETITTPQSGAALAQPLGNFEPKRVAPPPVRPVAIAKPEPVAAKPAEPKPIEPKIAAPAPAASALAAPAPAAAEPVAKFELASVPMPPARPEFGPAPKREAQPTRRSARLHERADKKPVAEARAKSDPKASTSGPAGVVTFLKKLVTPDKTTRKRSVEAEADPPHVQPPQ